MAHPLSHRSPGCPHPCLAFLARQGGDFDSKAAKELAPTSILKRRLEWAIWNGRGFNVRVSTSTFAQSINDRGQVAGFYQDTSGAVAGFLRRSNGTFKTVKFPAAANYSTVDQVNNSGVMAGEYQVTFLQGYLAFGSNFLSIDYPNSLASGLRGVNDRGAVSGYFVSQSGVFEAYVAIPDEDSSE